MKRLNIKVFGKVQGVFFRAFTKEKAELLGISGWVRNLPDGTVQIVAEGPEGKLEEFLGYVKQGPPLAVVTKVETFEEPGDGEFEGFEIRY